jgi:hypothetical protein
MLFINYFGNPLLGYFQLGNSILWLNFYWHYVPEMIGMFFLGMWFSFAGKISRIKLVLLVPLIALLELLIMPVYTYLSGLGNLAVFNEFLTSLVIVTPFPIGFAAINGKRKEK